jgi:HEAT repeat protein
MMNQPASVPARFGFRRTTALLTLAAMFGLIVSLKAAEPDNDITDAEKTLKDAGIASDNSGLLKFFKDRILSEDDRTKLEKAIRELGDDDFNVRERAEELLKKAGASARPFLKAAENNRDPEIVARVRVCLDRLDGGSDVRQTLAAAKLLAHKKPDGAAKLLLDYLPLAEDDYTRESIWVSLAALTLKDGKADQTIRTAAESKLPTIRCAAAFVLAQAGEDDRKLALKLFEDKDPAVRFLAASGLLRAGVKDSVPELMRLLTDAPTIIAYQSEDLLYRIAGEKPPTTNLGKGDDASRKKAREAWEGWWKTRADGIDLTKIELNKTNKGITLICEHDGSGTDGMGRIWECGRDGKVLWEINTDLGGPIDACIIPGGHVLTAEYKANRCTERDRDGKILWSYGTKSQAISCQRLPNGNTLIGTLTEIVEVTRENKVVTTIPATNGNIWSAYKQRNGNILYAESGGNVVEADAAGKRLQSVQVGGMGAWGGVELLPNGNLLVSKYDVNQIVEIDWKGKVISTANTPSPSYSSRLPNGNTLATNTNQNAIVEIDRDGKEVWKQQTTGRPFRTWRY